MRSLLERSAIFFLMFVLAVVASPACVLTISLSQPTPAPPVVPVTQVILVTQVVPVTRTGPAAPSALNTTQVEVYANRGWQDTGVDVSSGDVIVVEYVSGAWTGGIGAGPSYDGRGDLAAKYRCAEKVANPSICKEPLPNVYNGALIGRVGSAVVEIGNYRQFTSSAAGELFLRMNDHDEGLFDNSGSITVRITVQP